MTVTLVWHMFRFSPNYANSTRNFFLKVSQYTPLVSLGIFGIMKESIKYQSRWFHIDVDLHSVLNLGFGRSWRGLSLVVYSCRCFMLEVSELLRCFQRPCGPPVIQIDPQKDKYIQKGWKQTAMSSGTPASPHTPLSNQKVQAPNHHQYRSQKPYRKREV